MDKYTSDALVGLALAILLFLIFREVVCWYWKINVRVKLLTEIRDLLRNIERQPEAPELPSVISWPRESRPPR